ncbi:hypothetical protein [Flexithrix dorotheae]|uniref:hypothetical protein n=1 Tax=Flexithrix dorotheae TaxID=70993 RepID=UPI00036AB270|nr:hypothetical protein [Flexithrix dorotheae]
MKDVIAFMNQNPATRKVSKLDKLIEKISKGKELTAKQQESWSRYKLAIDLRNRGYNKEKVARLLEDKTGVNYSMAYRIMREADVIYGKITVTDKDAERSFYASRLEEIAEICIRTARGNEDGEVLLPDTFQINDNEVMSQKQNVALMKTAVAALKEAANIKGLNNSEGAKIINMPVINITSDPSAAGNEFEEVPTVEIPPSND